MAHLSLDLPDTLHQRLSLQARREGVSLDQFLVFLLSERSKPAYSVIPADKTVEDQEAAFAHLRSELGSTSDKEVWRILDERDPAAPEPDPGWTPELREALEERVRMARRSAAGS